MFIPSSNDNPSVETAHKPLQVAKQLPPDVFILHPENKAFVEGTSRHIKTSSSGCSILIMLGLGLFFWITAARNFIVAGQLQSYGVETQAQITRARTATSQTRNGVRTTYYVTYRFSTPAEDSYAHEQEVSAGTYERLRYATAVTVRYLPGDPGTVELSGSYSDSTGLDVWYFLAGVWLLATTIVTLISAPMMLRNLRYERQGRLFKGRLTHCAGSLDKKGYGVQVDYAFNAPGGQALSGRDFAMRSDLKNDPLPAVGTPVVVLYLDSRHYRLM